MKVAPIIIAKASRVGYNIGGLHLPSVTLHVAMPMG
jgi:hypothetical protein